MTTRRISGGDPPKELVDLLVQWKATPPPDVDSIRILEEFVNGQSMRYVWRELDRVFMKRRRSARLRAAIKTNLFWHVLQSAALSEHGSSDQPDSAAAFSALAQRVRDVAVDLSVYGYNFPVYYWFPEDDALNLNSILSHPAEVPTGGYRSTPAALSNVVHAPRIDAVLREIAAGIDERAEVFVGASKIVPRPGRVTDYQLTYVLRTLAMFFVQVSGGPMKNSIRRVASVVLNREVEDEDVATALRRK